MFPHTCAYGLNNERQICCCNQTISAKWTQDKRKLIVFTETLCRNESISGQRSTLIDGIFGWEGDGIKNDDTCPLSFIFFVASFGFNVVSKHT